MALLQKTDIPKIGITSIDEEHEVLLDTINQFYLSILHAESKERILYTFEQLLTYAQKHFRNEESYFQSTHYPYADEHIAEHRKFVVELMQLKEDFESKKSDLSYELLLFVSNWFNNHVLKADASYAPHFKKHGIK